MKIKDFKIGDRVTITGCDSSFYIRNLHIVGMTGVITSIINNYGFRGNRYAPHIVKFDSEVTIKLPFTNEKIVYKLPFTIDQLEYTEEIGDMEEWED